MEPSPAENYQRIQRHVIEIATKWGRNPAEIELIAVSKGVAWAEVNGVYRQGCRHFGENRLQEALPKIEEAPDDVQWHLIGRLQTNKVKKAIGQFACIHAVDTPELAHKISQYSVEASCVTSILLQVNTSGEETKQGLDPKGWESAFRALLELPALHIQGLMTMAPLTEDVERIRQTFRSLRLFRNYLIKQYGEAVTLPHLSMGMSHDYPIAIAEGATLLRIGSAIFDPLSMVELFGDGMVGG
jgi:pyridoxal phosphate enzyme (YggS family)